VFFFSLSGAMRRLFSDPSSPVPQPLPFLLLLTPSCNAGRVFLFLNRHYKYSPLLPLLSLSRLRDDGE